LKLNIKNNLISLFYLQKLLRRLVEDEGNNSGAGGLHELHVGGGNVGDAGGISEAAGGAVPGVADDSDDRLVVETGIGSGATGRRVTAELTREDDRRADRGGGKRAEGEGEEEEDPNGVA